jgi:hypothetical protein
MLGFSAFEKYFGDSQEDFLEKLEKRDFSVNKQAMLESGHTSAVAIPALMCPGFYDKWLKEKLSCHEKAMQLSSKLSNIPLFAAARLHNETIHAFKLAGYTSHTIAPLNVYFYPTTDYFYSPQGTIINGVWTKNRLLLIDYLQLQEFLRAFAFPLSILQYFMWDFNKIVDNQSYIPALLSETELKSILLSEAGILNHVYPNALKMVLGSVSPRFAIIYFDIAHCPYYLDDNGSVIAGMDNMQVMSYAPQHRFATKVLINLIDMILSEDKNAVIILQSDHGMHGNTKKEFAKYFKNEDSSIELWNSVMSAIRVPEQLSNAEEDFALSDPLNMSRYIVNSYVGCNYKYISEN